MFKNLFIVTVISILAWSCANKGYPEGGPKDETPPVMVEEVPASFSTNFSGKKIKIYFNEYIQLKDAKKNLVVSPPLKHKPNVSNRGKFIVVDLSRDTLKENITYSFDFGYSISDNNEGNPLGYYRYVLSTGNSIDTMEMGGQVVDAETGIPYNRIMVGLYKDFSDSVPIKKIPDYIAMTDSSGMFRFTNIQDSTYKVVALRDESADYKYLPGSENIGFMDTLVKPVSFKTTITDTVYAKILNKKNEIVSIDSTRIDTVIVKDVIAYGPANLYIRLFPEERKINYIESPVRKAQEVIDILFAKKHGADDMKISLTDSTLYDSITSPWYLMERNRTNDTLKMWITDSIVYRRKSVKLAIGFHTRNQADQDTVRTDTFNIQFNKKKEPKKLSISDSLKKIYSTVTLKPSGTLDINRHPQFEFERPVKKMDTSRITLEQYIDSAYVKIDYRLEQDSTNSRIFRFMQDFKEGTKYRVAIDSGAIFDIYGKPFQAITNEILVKKSENYGNLAVTASNVHGRKIILQLYKATIPQKLMSADSKKQKPLEISAHKSISKDGIYNFKLIKPGKYMLRAIIDRNGNKKWDSGAYLKKIQPEEILYQYQEIFIKENFDIEQDFDLDFKYEIPEVEDPFSTKKK